MDIKTLKQRLSLQHIRLSILRVAERFPVALAFIVCLTTLLTYMVITRGKPNCFMQWLLIFLPVGTIISLCTSLWGEEQTDKRKRWIAEIVLLAIYGIYCIFLCATDFHVSCPSAFFYGNAAWITAVVMMVVFGSFMREKNDLKSWHFMISLLAALLISSVVTGIMAGGLEGLVYGTTKLFDLTVGDELPAIILVVCIVLLWSLLFLALIPQAERKHNDSTNTPSFLTKSVSWLLLPLLCCYIVVLYVYGINILVHWELPKGMISWLVSAVMAGYVLCYILLYPQATNKQLWQSKVLTFWLPIAILPLLVMMSVGVARRFMDYGVTAPRLYLLTLLLWFYAVCIAMLAMPRKSFRWLFLSLGALFLLTSGHPLNYYRICRPILAAKIDQTIAEKGLQTPIALYSLRSNPALTSEEASDLYTELIHMRSDYGEDFVSRWIENDTEVSNDSIEEETWKVHYYNYHNEFLCPQGYPRYQRIDRSFTYSSDTLAEKDLRTGIIPVVYEKDIVLQFDTAAINRAAVQSEPMIIYSSDKRAAYVPTFIRMDVYSDHQTNVQYAGFLFSKGK